MAADTAGLRLRAEDPADLVVISAVLQDALVPVADLAYAPEDRRFFLVANRFRWEEGRREEAEETVYRRTLCALAFGDVASVSYRGFRRSESERILSLLAIRWEAEGSAAAICLEFSGGARIRLRVDALSCHAKDLGEPWPTRWQPGHDLEERP